MCILAGVVMLFASCFAFAACAKEEKEEFEEVNAITDLGDESRVNLYGRNYYNDDLGGMAFTNAAAGFEVRIRGTELTASVQGLGSWKTMFSVFIDGERDSNARIVTIETGASDTLIFAEGLSEGEHTVKVLKRNDSLRNTAVVTKIETDGVFLEAPERPAIKLEVYGCSVTTGSGILREVTYDEATGKYNDSNVYTAETQNIFQAYPGIAADILGAELQIFGRGGIAMKYTTGMYTVSNNYGSVAVDLPASEYPYDYNSWRPDAVVIYLGGNDYLQGSSHNIGYSIDGVKVAYIEFIRNVIGTYYGKDIPIVLCSGMHTAVRPAGLEACMQSVKSMLVSEFPKLDAVEFEPCVVGHPIVSENKAAGEKLAAKLKELLGI